MVGAPLGKEGLELLPEDGLDEVRFECGHGACSFRSGSVENSPNDGASVPALHHDALPIDGSSKPQNGSSEGAQEGPKKPRSAAEEARSRALGYFPNSFGRSILRTSPLRRSKKKFALPQTTLS